MVRTGGDMRYRRFKVELVRLESNRLSTVPELSPRVLAPTPDMARLVERTIMVGADAQLRKTLVPAVPPGLITSCIELAELTDNIVAHTTDLTTLCQHTLVPCSNPNGVGLMVEERICRWGFRACTVDVTIIGGQTMAIPVNHHSIYVRRLNIGSSRHPRALLRWCFASRRRLHDREPSNF